MNDHPLVSIIITTYGGSIKLVRAVRSCLRQSYSDIQIIVVDDNDPESEGRKRTAELMKSFNGDSKIQYIMHPRNLNGAAARNTGIEAADGEYIAFLDDDDFILNSRIEDAVNLMKDNAEAIGCCFGVVFIRNDKVTRILQNKNKSFLTQKSLLLNKNILGTGSNLFIRADIVHKVNGFDITFKRFQDIEFMLRTLNRGEVIFSDKLDIVKDCSDVRSSKYETAYKAQELFNNKFSAIINQLSEEEKNKYYMDLYGSLFYLALKNNDKDSKSIQKSMANKYMKYGGKKKYLLHLYLNQKIEPLKQTYIFQIYKKNKMKNEISNVETLQKSQIDEVYTLMHLYQ